MLTIFVIGLCLSLVSGDAQISQKRSLEVTISRSLPVKPISMITENDFILFENSIQHVKTEQCQKDLNRTLWGIVDGVPWATTMYDSSAKAPVGIESGSVYQFGNFDECVDSGKKLLVTDDDAERQHPRVLAKYCLADVTISGLTVKSIASRNYKVSNSTVVHWGICIPASCTANDVENFMSNLLDYEVHIPKNRCHFTEEFQVTKGMIIYSCVILGFVIMVIFSTFYHLNDIIRGNMKRSNSEGCFDMIMKSFSAIENLKKLVQQSNDHLGLNAINGIKAISMLCIISGHALLFIVSGPVLNSSFFAYDIKLVQNAFILNSPLFVDTFLLLSGFLFCRILLKELERRDGNINVFIIYIFRYTRLTPAYLAIIAFYATWLPKIGSGPLWNSRMLLEQERCQESWWLNILYINNYFGTDKLCMFQSWYLSADTQLFILAPCVIFLLWKSRKMGLWLIAILMAISAVIPFSVTYFQDLDPTFLGYADEVEDISANMYFRSTYVKTHMRATAYIFGLLTGFLLHYIQEKSIKIPKNLVIALWISSTIIGIASMFSITIFFNNSYSALESSLYASLHRFGWSFFSGWLVLGVSTGNSGFLKTLLSSSFFVPLSRLTYCAYLTNGLVELYNIGIVRSPMYMSRIKLLGETTSHNVFTFMTALILCLIFESPIHGIEKIFLKRDMRRRQLSREKDNQTPSTSEETA